MLGTSRIVRSRAAIGTAAVICVLSLKAIAADGGLDRGAAATKFHPGHYVALPVRGDIGDVHHLDTPGIVGVSKRYKWRHLEPRRDAYDFAAIREDLDRLAGHDKQLVVFLIDRSFSQWPSLPSYLAQYEIAIDGGTCPARWEARYVERLVALGRALGDAFDEHPHFEGVAIQETSLGLPADVRDALGYTHERYRDALIAILRGLDAAMPRSRVFWYQNFFPDGEQDYLREIATAMLGTGVVMGGPDILPHRRYMNAVAYPLYDAYRGKLPLFCSAQNDSYKHHANDTRLGRGSAVPATGFLPIDAIFRFARDELHVSYLFWDHRTEVDQHGERTFSDALKVIRRHPKFNEALNAGFVATRAERE